MAVLCRTLTIYDMATHVINKLLPPHSQPSRQSDAKIAVVATVTEKLTS